MSVEKHPLAEQPPATSIVERFSEAKQRAAARDRKDCDRVSQSLWMEFMGLRNDSIALVRGLRLGDMDRGGTHPIPHPTLPFPQEDQPALHAPEE